MMVLCNIENIWVEGFLFILRLSVRVVGCGVFDKAKWFFRDIFISFNWILNM